MSKRFSGWEKITSAAGAKAGKAPSDALKAAKHESANRITRNVLTVINGQPGCVAYRVNNVGVYDEAIGARRKGNTERGLPDVWACVMGRFLTVEVKAGRDELSPYQQMRKFEIEKAGGIFFVARSTGEFTDFFSNLVKKIRNGERIP